MIAIVSQVGIRIFACYLFDSGIHTSHKLIYVVKAQGTPSIVLAWLNKYIGMLDCSTKHAFLELTPVLFSAIECAHIVHIHLGNIALALPLISCIDELLNTCVIPTL